MVDPAFWFEVLTYLIQVFAVFGGIYSLIQLIDRLRRKPTLTGNVDQYIGGTISDQQQKPIGLVLTLQMYMVNKSLHPTTIRAWDLWVKIGAKWIRGRHTMIKKDLWTPHLLPMEIDFSKSLLYDICAEHYLEYAKGVHVWLEFHLLDPSITIEQLKDAPIKLVVADELGWKHHISDTLRGGEQDFCRAIEARKQDLKHEL